MSQILTKCMSGAVMLCLGCIILNLSVMPEDKVFTHHNIAHISKNKGQQQENTRKPSIKNRPVNYTVHENLAILILGSEGKAQPVLNSLNNLLQVSSNLKPSNIIVSIKDADDETIKVLEKHQIKLYKHYSIKYQERLRTQQGMLENVLDSLRSSSNYFNDIYYGNNKYPTCVQENITRTINILQTTIDFHSISKYSPKLSDLKEGHFITPSSQSPFNPLFRKALQNEESREILRNKTVIENIKNKFKNAKLFERWRELEDHDDSPLVNDLTEDDHCTSATYLKASLNAALRLKPQAEYVLIVEENQYFSPDFMRYIHHLLPMFALDQGIYCASAINPLLPNKHHQGNWSLGDPTKVFRVDHFVGKGATVISRSLAKELLQKYVVYLHEEEFPSVFPQDGSPMGWLTRWLSWWSHRKMRSCLVAGVPRVCSMKEQKWCMDDYSDVPMEDISSLIRFRFNHNRFSLLKESEVINEQMKTCHPPSDLLHYANKSYVVYVKLENYDDDLSLCLLMKCFGIDITSSVGHFEGSYSFYYKESLISILTLPYSRFSPTMVVPTLLMFKGSNEPVQGMYRLVDHLDRPFNNFSNISVIPV